MKIFNDSFSISTCGKGTYPITPRLATGLKNSGIRNGLLTVLIAHTSASLVIYENADPTAREDLHRWMERLVPENDPHWIHTLEGADDSTSHLRMALTRSSENIPVQNGRLTLGTWQGVYVFEHRRAPQERLLHVAILGE
ncbi:MAG: secondary thiamine-phosphate synthase enzyme YjbQ [Verrucomicrobiae bacterium]|nr:secondary thiamine-phosphate synthase enzyme YjbQ [Verrucomicrobiae bacterium]